MGLNKKPEAAITETSVAEASKMESGTEAAIERLKATVTKHETKPAFKQRDFDQENRGKTKCVMFEAALMSPAIAGMQFIDMKEYLKLVEEAANAGYRYTWDE